MDNNGDGAPLSFSPGPNVSMGQNQTSPGCACGNKYRRDTNQAPCLVPVAPSTASGSVK